MEKSTQARPASSSCARRSTGSISKSPEYQNCGLPRSSMKERSSGEPLMCACVEMSPGVRTRSGASTVSFTRPSKAMTYPARMAMRRGPAMSLISSCRLDDVGVLKLVDAVNGMVLEPAHAGAVAEDPADVLDGHHHGLAHQALLDALEGLDALGLLEGHLRLMEEGVRLVVAPAHGVRAGDGRGDEEVQEVGRGVDHGQEARVVLPCPRRRGEGGRLEPLDLKIEAHLPELRLHGRHDALVQLGEDVERGLERLAVFLPHAVASRHPARLRQEALRL